MKKLAVFIVCVMLVFMLESCSEVSNTSVNTAKPIDTTNTKVDEEFQFSEYQMYYAVLADTGRDYASLRTTMFRIAKELNHPIDTMERYFDEATKELKLAEDSDDELYAGYYFPRRFEGNFLSIEYLYLYDKKANSNTMAVVAGSFLNRNSADSLCRKMKPITPKSIVVMFWEYDGCIH
jgi:gamma-glutamylcyclotransferase (GGCT)/AIG2-like uncharacterized protein YtfP